MIAKSVFVHKVLSLQNESQSIQAFYSAGTRCRNLSFSTGIIVPFTPLSQVFMITYQIGHNTETMRTITVK